jgi:purine-binding chemotaxis protein CheW
MSTDVLDVQTSLPPSGLAEDILGAKVDTDIYTFADSLQTNSGPETGRATRIETWVTFALGGETFGLPVTHVVEILRVSGITRVPHAPPTVRGMTNMRGKVLPVVDLRVCLGSAPVDLDPQRRILVVASRGRHIGLLVDAVDQVERIDRNAVQPPPPDVMTSESEYIIGVIQVSTRLVILLDADRVLSIHSAATDKRRAVSSAQGE